MTLKLLKELTINFLIFLVKNINIQKKVVSSYINPKTPHAMRKLNYLFVLFLLLSFVACNESDVTDSVESFDGTSIIVDKQSTVKLNPTTMTPKEIEAASCGDLVVYTLYAGQSIEVGTLTVSNDADNVYVTYNTTGDWWLKETHLFVGNYADLPLNNGNNPVIGSFPYHGEHGLVQTYSFTIPIDEAWGNCFTVAAHASVVRKDQSGAVVQSETAFGCGNDSSAFPGNRWGCYNQYCLQECKEYSYAFLNKNQDPFFTCFSNSGLYGWSNHYPYYFYLAGGTSKYYIYKNTDNNCGIENDQVVGYIESEMLYARSGNEEMKLHFNMTGDQYKYEIYVGWKNPIENGMLLADIPFVNVNPGTMEFDYQTALSSWYGLDPRIADPSLNTNPVFYVIVKVIIP